MQPIRWQDLVNSPTYKHGKNKLRYWYCAEQYPYHREHLVDHVAYTSSNVL